MQKFISFEGIGGMVYIDENGDRDIDIDLMDMEPTTGKFRVTGFSVILDCKLLQKAMK